MLPMEKMLLQRQIELFKIWGTVRKILYWEQISVFHDIILCRLDSLISQLSLNSKCEKIKRNCQVPHHGLSVQQFLFHLLLNN